MIFLAIVGCIYVNNEPWIPRIQTRSATGRESAFRNGIRARDGRCVITGVVNLNAINDNNNWVSFQAAHIFPLVSESHFIHAGYSQYITDMDDTTGISKIHSLQNGLLLRSHVHGKFDQYCVSVNPDDGYKVVVFDQDADGLDGRTLDRICRDPADPHRVSDNLLRWH